MRKWILSDEEKLFFSRVTELAERCRQRCVPAFTGFLTDREQAIFQSAAESVGMRGQTVCFGGYPDAERAIGAFFPDYCFYDGAPSLSGEFPIRALSLVCSGFREHTHRDYLGSLLGLGVDRSVVGDILVCESGDAATVFVHEKIVPFFLENLKLVGRDGVRVTLASDGEIAGVERRYDEIRGTCHSMRVDAVLAEVLGLSREKAEKLIADGSVEIGHCPVTEKSEPVELHDVITVRGYGKYRVDETGDVNRRGRIRFLIRKYR